MERIDEAVDYENGGERDPHKQAAYAVGVARAVLETTHAEKELATSLVEEAQVYLQATQDIADAVDERLSVAEDQHGELIDAACWRGFPVAAPWGFDTHMRSHPRLRRAISRRSSHSEKPRSSPEPSESRRRDFKPGATSLPTQTGGGISRMTTRRPTYEVDIDDLD
jgi:hypothetical protein